MTSPQMHSSVSHHARVYWMLQKNFVKSRMAYRADFLISSVGLVTQGLLNLGVLWVLLDASGQLAGWTFDDIVFIYAFYLLAISPYQIVFENMWELRFSLQEGAFLKYYFRPLNMLVYFLAEKIDLKGISQLVLAVGLMGWASSNAGVAWGFGNLLLFLLALAGAAITFGAIFMLTSCAGFWIINSWPVLAFMLRVRDMAPFPTNVFSGALRFFLTFVLPVTFVAYVPASELLAEAPSILRMLSPIPVGLLLAALAYAVWLAGVRHYDGTGS